MRGIRPWAELREAQLMALALTATGMAVAIDAGDERNIHPPRKPPARRASGCRMAARRGSTMTSPA